MASSGKPRRNASMHKDNLVVSIVTAEGICRENSGQVYLPYGTEYSLRLKNLDSSKRAIVKVSIDGDCVTENGILIEANATFDLKGFLKGDCVRNSFKFIELTDRIRDHKGDRPDWGIIAVSFQFEDNLWQDYQEQQKRYKEIMDAIERARKAREIEDAKQPWKDSPRYPYPPYPNKPWITWKNQNKGGILRASTLSHPQCINAASCQEFGQTESAGITVPGTPVHQDFQSVAVGRLGPAHTLSLALVGQKPDQTPVRAVRTARRASCPTCGLRQKGNAKYCTECGTCLL